MLQNLQPLSVVSLHTDHLLRYYSSNPVVGRWLVCHTTMERLVVVRTDLPRSAAVVCVSQTINFKPFCFRICSPFPWSRGTQTTYCDINIALKEFDRGTYFAPRLPRFCFLIAYVR